MPPIHNVFLPYIRSSLLFISVIRLLMKNDLIISYTTGITRPGDGKGTRSADEETRAIAKAPVDVKALADAETPTDMEMLVNVEKEINVEKERLADIGRKALMDAERERLGNTQALVDKKASADAKRDRLVDMEKKRLVDKLKLVVICYKHQYLYT